MATGDSDALEMLRSSKIAPEDALGRFTDGAGTDEQARDRAITRAAYVAATADLRCLDEVELGTEHNAQLDFGEFKAFARSVWREEGRDEPLYVSLISSLPSHTQALLVDAEASARWAYPPADSIGVARQGELAGTVGPVAYIDVTERGCNRLVALHEVAHLLSDDLEHHEGHSERWAAMYGDLQLRHLGWEVAGRWAFEWSWWLLKAVEHLDRDPEWVSAI